MITNRLNRAALITIPISMPATPVILPAYNPANCASGIVHIGIGAFHKAHQAVYTDDVLNLYGGDWRITAVSLRNPTARDQLTPQDGLYTVVEKNDKQIQHRIIGAVEKVLVAQENPTAVIAVLAQAATKIVSLTITEKGYCQSKGALDLHHPDIAHDLKNPAHPITMPGFIVAACVQRKQQQESGLTLTASGSTPAGFTLISCDNLQHNGQITRAVVIGFAQQIDAELAQWINDNITFCSTMVDRIVPATTPQDITDTRLALGFEDAATVICEPFRQWVIEDNFCNGRPRWEDAGALIVKDVTPFETMKLRLLNGSHSALAYLGFLSGYHYIHQAIANPEFYSLIAKLMDDEVSPTLAVPTGFELAPYKKTIRDRFANSQVPYKTTQVANDGSQKIPQRLLATANELIQQGRRPHIIALIIAAWFRFLEAEDSEGNSFEINDPLARQLTPVAREHRQDEKKQVNLLMETSGIFADSLMINEDFKQDIIDRLTQMHRVGVALTVTDFLAHYKI